MLPPQPAKLRLFVDADVLFAGAASPTEHGASLVLLRMAELTLIEAITSTQVITEVQRNLRVKMPQALPIFEELVGRCLTVVEAPTVAQCQPYHGLADAKDLSILVAAIQAHCPWLVTFNLRHFQPGHPAIHVLLPGDFVRKVRAALFFIS